jgi:uncharacterized protein (TIGR03435 family)
VGKEPPQLPAAKDGEETLIRTGDRHELIFQGVNMFRLVNYLHQIWHMTVVDRTGMKGTFDFSINPDSFAAESSAQDPSRTNSFADRVRAAIEELGFKVETQKTNLDVTVIDHAERPSEN